MPFKRKLFPRGYGVIDGKQSERHGRSNGKIAGSIFKGTMIPAGAAIAGMTEAMMFELSFLYTAEKVGMHIYRHRCCSDAQFAAALAVCAVTAAPVARR